MDAAMGDLAKPAHHQLDEQLLLGAIVTTAWHKPRPTWIGARQESKAPASSYQNISASS
jgi:hypothetical protein